MWEYHHPFHNSPKEKVVSEGKGLHTLTDVVVPTKLEAFISLATRQ